MSEFPFSKIILLGTTSSGKSTLAEILSRQLGLSLIELDALHWEANWKSVTDEVFLENVEQALKAEQWVVAGSYHIARDTIWAKADLAIWLDYSFTRIFWQLSKRIYKRWRSKELLWGKTHETGWIHLKIWSEESLYHWLFMTYWKRKKEYPLLFSEEKYSHIKVLRFSNPEETAQWMKDFIR